MHIAGKKHFLFLLENYQSLTKEETIALASLQKEFPYSQVIRNMVTWGAWNNNLNAKQKQLQSAILYAANQPLLKAIVTMPRVDRAKITHTPPKTQHSKAEKTTTPDSPSNIEKTSIPPFPPTPLDPEMSKIWDELPKNLLKLQHLAHDFEEVSETINNPTKQTPTKKPAKTETPNAPKKKTTRKPVKNIKTKRIAPKTKITKTPKSTSQKKNSPKQEEQLEIIDRFIRSKPKINKEPITTSEPAPITDSSPVNTPEETNSLNENIISETLVQILIDQGKKDQAIDVIKKLIWKIPQKKAEFMAQIELLKNK